MQSSSWNLLQHEIDLLLQNRSPRTQNRVQLLVAQCNAFDRSQQGRARPQQPLLLCGGMIQHKPEVVGCFDEWKCGVPGSLGQHVAMGCFDGTCSIVQLRGVLPHDVTSVVGPSTVVTTLVAPRRAAVVSIACSATHPAAAVGCGDGLVYVWSLLAEEGTDHTHGPQASNASGGGMVVDASHRSEDDLMRYLAAATPTGSPCVGDRKSMSLESMIVDSDEDLAASGFDSHSDLSSPFEGGSKNSNTSSLADHDDDDFPDTDHRQPSDAKAVVPPPYGTTTSSSRRHSVDSSAIRVTPVCDRRHRSDDSAALPTVTDSTQRQMCTAVLSMPRDCCTAVSWVDSNVLLCGMRSGSMIRVDPQAAVQNDSGIDELHRLLFRTVDAGRIHGPISKIAVSPHTHPSSQLVCIGTSSGMALLADLRIPAPALTIPAVTLPAKSAGRCLRDVAFSTTSEHVFWTGGDERLLKTWDLRKLVTATSSKEKSHAIRSIAHLTTRPAAGDASSSPPSGWLVVTEADDLISVTSAASHDGSVAAAPILEFKNLHKRSMLASSCTVRLTSQQDAASIVTGSISGAVSELVISV